MRTARSSVLTVLLAAGSWVGATTFPKPPTMEDLAKVWVGGGVGGIYDFYRLELDKEGKGLIISASGPDGPTTAYRITETSLSKYKVVFVLVPLDSAGTPTYLRGDALASRMNLEIGGSDWKRAIFLQGEAELLGKLAAVTERANRERK